MRQLVLGREGTLKEQEAPGARLAAGTSDPAISPPASNAPPGPAEAPAGVATPQDGYLRCAMDGCPVHFRRRQPKQRFCSSLCRAAWWDRQHPRLNPPHIERGASVAQLVLGILQDMKWHSVQDLAVKAHQLPCSVSARLRELRRKGHRIERDGKVGNTRRQHKYRLVVP